MLLGEYRCPRCGRVHLRISREDAESAVANFNRRLQPGEQPARIEEYLYCFGCGAPADAFVPARSDDAPGGVTLTLCVVEPETPPLHDPHVAKARKILAHYSAERLQRSGSTRAPFLAAAGLASLRLTSGRS